MQLFGFQFHAMGTENEIRLYAPDLKTASYWSDTAIAEVRRIEYAYSRYRPDSMISRINQAAGQAPVGLDDETAQLLHYAAALYEQSKGLFDITSGVLRRAWQFQQASLPDPAKLAHLLTLVDWRQVCIEDHQVSLLRPGMELDLGGIGKEYAADRAATLCLQAGAHHGFINLGGDIRVIGPQVDGSPWRFGIQHPRDASRMLCHIALSQGALASSGDYERYFDYEGKRYCHILNPQTGFPVQTWQSVTVIAPLCIVCGSMTTIAMLMEADAEKFLQQQGVSYLLVNQASEMIHALDAPQA